MRWPAHFILVYIALALQLGLAPYIAVNGAIPNLVLLAVVFVALNAARDAALVGCLITGLLQDMLTGQQFGSHGFAYGLVAMFVVNLQQVVYRDHPLTHFVLTFVGGLITAFVVAISGWLHAGSGLIGVEFKRALYTAVLAPVVLLLLARFRAVFAFKGVYRKTRR